MLRNIKDGLTLRTINRVIRFLIFSDFFLNTAWGFLGPVFAIFIVEKIALNNPTEGAKIAGFSALVYWITKSFLQIPVSNFFDKRIGEKDDYWFMIIGLFLSSLIPIGFLFSSLPWHIYLLQIIHGTALALFVPSWNAIFTRHIDKGKEASEWALNSTFLGIGTGIAGALGGIFVAFFGFKAVFILVFLFNLISAILLLFVQKNILPMDHTLDNIWRRIKFLPFKKTKYL